MKRGVVVTGLVALAVVVPHSAWGIAYGEPDNGRHPNVGSLVILPTNPDTGETTALQFCTGTLVAPTVVVTASHCLFIPPDYIGDPDVFTFDEVIDADRDGEVDPNVQLLSGTPVLHPQYAEKPFRANNPYDLAVFLLDEPVLGVTPAQLPEAGLLNDRALADERFAAVGYGTVRQSIRRGTEALSAGWRRELATQELLSVTKAMVKFSMNPATGNGGACFGDSGGPHFLGDVIVATTVRGDAQCKAADWSYRLDTSYARDFLAPYVTLP